ncbi:protein serine/threonine phosphatase 2C [Amylostereum chailletii]|nr:protein serine/threonine phosphatase 2C [Amylostereum chailletii]
MYYYMFIDIEMLRRAWRPLTAATVALAAPSAYLYYGHRLPRFTAQETAQITDWEVGPNNEPQEATRTIVLLPKDIVDQRLTENATIDSNHSSDGLVWKFSTAYIASNNPIEDTHAHAIVTRASTAFSTPGELMFFTIMDGHAGPYTSQLLSKILIPAVCLKLANLVHERPSSKSYLDGFKSLIYRSKLTDPQSSVDPSPEAVSKAISKAFTDLDSEIISTPLQFLAESRASMKSGAISTLLHHPMAVAATQVAASGSCALMAMIDTAKQDIYVACTGDSRAVAGVWEEAEDGGHWRVEALSVDQSPSHPKELKRLQDEHPDDDANDLVKAGRVLGVIAVARAFGDARFKWSLQAQQAITETFLPANKDLVKPIPLDFKSGTYITAMPEVTHRKLSLLANGTSTAKRSTLRFIVLASDGLWDELSSEDAVALVGGFLAGLKGTKTKTELAALVPTVANAEDKTNRAEIKHDSWAFVDDNVGSHLIRNAFGGGDEATVRKTVSIPSPFSRNFRDDVTVTVVWWEEEKAAL